MSLHKILFMIGARTSLTIALVLFLAGAIGSHDVQAQTVSLGADMVSRYVWRGSDFGESFSVQPMLAVSGGGFEIGTWASYSISADGSSVNEHDLYASYSFDLGNSGALSIAITDYYFPAPDGPKFFNYKGDGAGAHWIEPALGYTGPESFPITVYGAFFVHNDPDNSIYLEASYPFEISSVEFGLTAGVSAKESAMYATVGFGFINLGISATKAIEISDRFSLPVSVSYILNPEIEKTYLVFGFGIGI
jgi:uncharacterized protein (TIGR02001 family)